MVSVDGDTSTNDMVSILANGMANNKEITEDGEDFDKIGDAFEKECPVQKASLGNGTITFMKQRELVDFAVKWIERNRK